MRHNYILGVDGGGTKTHCALYDLNNDTASLMSWSATNHERLKGGYEELRKVISEMLYELCSKHGITLNDIGTSCFTLSGVDFPYQEKYISDMLEEVGVQNFILKNDTFAGIKANCEEGYGIAAVNGTGCCVAGIDEIGETLQIGGLGAITNDKGGSRNMVLTALNLIYNQQLRSGEETLLTVNFASALETDEKNIIQKGFFAFEQGNLQYIKDMSIAVYKSANEGDAAAISILKEIGDEYARCIDAVYEGLNFTSPKIPVALIGTQFVKCENKTVIERIFEKLEESAIDYDVRISDVKPVAGAVIWAAERAGVSDEQRKLIRSKMSEL